MKILYTYIYLYIRDSFQVQNCIPADIYLTSFRCLYCYLWTEFIHCFGVSIVASEQVNASWATDQV